MIRYTVHQIDTRKDERNYAFMSKQSLLHFKITQFPPPSDVYDIVYSDRQKSFDPEDVFRIFNLEHPNDYKGRSISVSDVIEYCLSETNSLYLYCDSFGFEGIDFGDEYKVAKDAEYHAGADMASDTVTLFYQKGDRIRSVTANGQDIFSGRKIGLSDDGQKIALTPSEVYNILKKIISGRVRLNEEMEKQEVLPFLNDLVTQIIF